MVARRVVLVDCMNLVYRSHFARTHLRTENGVLTGIVHGFITSLLSLAKKYPEAPLVFCWDGGRSWRHAIATQEYKAGRERNEELQTAIHIQVPQVEEFLRQFGFKQVKVSTIEADDFIGELAYALPKCPEPYEVLIYSGDRDFYQCINRQVKVVQPNSKGKSLVDEQSVYKEFGVYPERYASLRALAGDDSDTYKPIPGIGLKRALSYIQAGVEPANKRFEAHSNDVQASAQVLKPHWSAVHRCYRLCRLPAGKYMPVGLHKEMTTQVDVVVANPNRELPDGVTVGQLRMWFWNFTGRFELASLFGKYADLCRIV